ncbi:MAG: hypothetical protein HY900_17470 [Deltaproteobacteria bacterium]|nr:hypothetical protein [Deltaproteobacteria bacterium]
MDVLDKLHHLLPHWIEHNESHVATFREWSERAEQGGAGAAAAALREAIRSVEAANEALRRAEQSLAADHEHHNHHG